LHAESPIESLKVRRAGERSLSARAANYSDHNGLRGTARLSQNAAHMSTRSLRALEWPMAVLALLIVPALVLKDRATDPRLREAAHVLN
jgi:hypothetical protein